MKIYILIISILLSCSSFSQIMKVSFHQNIDGKISTSESYSTHDEKYFNNKDTLIPLIYREKNKKPELLLNLHNLDENLYANKVQLISKNLKLEYDVVTTVEAIEDEYGDVCTINLTKTDAKKLANDLLNGELEVVFINNNKKIVKKIPFDQKERLYNTIINLYDISAPDFIGSKENGIFTSFDEDLIVRTAFYKNGKKDTTKPEIEVLNDGNVNIYNPDYDQDININFKAKNISFKKRNSNRIVYYSGYDNIIAQKTLSKDEENFKLMGVYNYRKRFYLDFKNNEISEIKMLKNDKRVKISEKEFSKIIKDTNNTKEPIKDYYKYDSKIDDIFTKYFSDSNQVLTTIYNADKKNIINLVSFFNSGELRLLNKTGYNLSYKTNDNTVMLFEVKNNINDGIVVLYDFTLGYIEIFRFDNEIENGPAIIQLLTGERFEYMYKNGEIDENSIYIIKNDKKIKISNDEFINILIGYDY